MATINENIQCEGEAPHQSTGEGRFVIQQFIENQKLVQNGLYTPSLVAVLQDHVGGIYYSVNYACMQELTFDAQCLIKHRTFINDMCPDNLEVCDCKMIQLKINSGIIVKLQVVYKKKICYASFEGYDLVLLNKLTHSDYVWANMCKHCQFVGVYYNGNEEEVVLQRRKNLMCNCSPHIFQSKFDLIELLPMQAHFESAGVTDGQREVETSNVVLSETQQQSIELASNPVLPLWHKLSTSEFDPSFSDMCDRFIPWKYFTWKVENMKEDTAIVSANLPIDFINSHGKVYCNTVNFIPFNVHAYWRGDMEVKVHINSNMFQSGQLIGSWLYASDDFASTGKRVSGGRYSNIAQLVQKPHIIINAGASNEATLNIPYRYVKPYMRTKPIYKGTVAATPALNMGRFVLSVMVPLRTGSAQTSPQECSGTIFVRLVNNSFTGKFSGAIAQPEMAGVSSVLKNVVGTVDKILGDVNCDNPPDTTPPPFLVPLNAQNWSHGMKTREPINTLRLDGRVIGCGRSPDIGYSETGIKRIAEVYGLLRPFEWSATDVKSNKAGVQLWGMAVHPQCDKDKMYSVEAVGDWLATYTIPPVGVVASLFCYWRGSIDFKFEIVATSKHTGRLLIAYIPGIDDYKVITIEQAMSSSHAVFSLNTGTTSFTFRVPYIAETMWWTRKYGGAQQSSDFIAPSSIVVFVLNPMVPMESVSQKITILPYVAAGPDFEVAVPAQPSIGLGLNRVNEVPGSDIISFKSGYYPVYVGEWRNWMDGVRVILRYGNVTDHIAQLTTPIKTDPQNVVIYFPQTPIPQVVRTQYAVKPNSGRRFVDNSTGCSLDVNNNQNFDGMLYCGIVYSVDSYNYMIPFFCAKSGAQAPTPNDALGAAKIVAFALKKNKVSAFKDVCNTYISDSGWINNSENIYWIGREYPKCTVKAEFEMASESYVTPNPLQPTSLLPPTNDGVVTFGERFYDFKDMCRRYQLYWEGSVTPGQIRSNKRNAAFVQIPAMPQGLSLNATIDNPVWNSMRDGHIPIISSGFRFYRGGMRMRIVITGLNDSVWIQHHPDRFFFSQKPKVGNDIHDKDAYRNHTYGFHVQNLTVNRTIEVEVPFYKPGLYNLLGDVASSYDSKEYGSLGDIVIGLEGDQAVTEAIDIAVYYTIADDCSFNVFCGFPDMVFCDDVYKKNVTPAVKELDFELLDIPITYADREMMSLAGVATSSIGSMFGSVVSNVAFRGHKVVTDPIVRVVKQEVKTNMMPVMKNVEDEVRNAAKDISATLGRTIPQQAIISALGQFSQVALNPTPTSLAIAITSLLANFVTISMELIISMQHILTNFLTKTWSKYFSGASDHQEAQKEINSEGFFENMSDKSLYGFLGMVFTAVASTIGYACATPKKFPDVMKGVKECLNTCNAAVVFFRNIMDAVTYMYKYILGESDEELRAKIIVEREYPHMKDWCQEVMLLLDPRNQNAILHSSKQANRVFDACIYGAKLINENLDRTIPGGKVIYDLYMKICKLRDDLIELGNHPDIRFEAFPIWVCGKAGIGKSYMTQKICQDLLTHIDYKTQECMIYWLALGQKYWNGIKNPPVIARDEAYAVGGQFTEEEIATHLAICSCSILNPPMAALQEKNKRLNPLIYYMNSNMEFPQINEARHPEAIYRRRKLLVKVQYTTDILSRYPNILDASELPPSETENMKHLEFYIARDPKNTSTTYAGPYTYINFISIAKDKFKLHVDNERNNFKARMNAAYMLDPDYNELDELNFVNGSTLPSETLHEQYIQQRNEAHRILYSAPPTIEEGEDSYLENILSRFRYLWTIPENAQPEMGDDYPNIVGEQLVVDYAHINLGASTSLSRDSSRSAATRLGDKVKIDRAALLKLVSGGINTSEDDMKQFVVGEEFEKLIKSKKNPNGLWSRFCYCYEYNSMLPDSWVSAWKQAMMNDAAHSASQSNTKKILPHWEDVTGTEAIRSYVYWLMREQQYKVFAHLLYSQEGSKENIRTKFEKLLKSCHGELRSDMVRVLNAKSMEELIAATAVLDAPNGSYDCVVDMWLILYYINEHLKMNEEDFCLHCRFWLDNLKDTSRLEYIPRYDKVIYTNTLGLRVTCPNYCDCKHSLSNNTLFQNAMRIIWNKDHGMIEHSVLNPFSFAEHKTASVQLETWYERLFAWAKDWWKGVAIPYVSAILTFIYEHLGQIISILLGLYSLYKLYNSSAGESVVQPIVNIATETVASSVGTFVASVVAKHDVDPVVVEKVSVESSNYSKVDKPKPAMANFKPAEKEGENSSDRIEVLERRLLDNVCFLEARWNDEHGDAKMLVGRCLGIRERQVLVLKHYIEEMLRQSVDTCFMLNYVKSGKPCTGFLTRECLEKVTYFRINGRDDASNFGILHLPKFMPMFRDILNSIVRRADHHYVASVGHIMSVDMEGRVNRYRQMPLRARAFLVIDGEADGSVSKICNDGAYEYSVHGKGMCGSLLLCANVCRGNPGIVALHVAGAKGNGYAEPIYREMFEHEVLKPKITYMLPQLGPAEESQIALDSNLLTMGIVEKKFSHHESGKTKIIPSLLHNKIYSVQTEPNPLKPNDPRQPMGAHPLRDGCNKHGFGMSIPFNPKLLEIVSHDSRMVLKNYVKNPLAALRELTIEEAICGTTAIPHCESLNWKSSEGFPLSSFRPAQYSNKKYLFDLEETNEGYKLHGLHPDLQQILTVRESLRERSVCVPPIYIDCLKDYRMTPEKCAIPGKTRIFSIAPVQVTIDLRRYMGVFLSAYRSAGVEVQHGIGINVDSMEWSVLARYLHEVGDNIVTGDYSNFGPTLSSQVVLSCIEDIVEWHRFNNAPQKVLDNLNFILENEILNPIHLCQDLVYQTVNGIASGSPITAELNSEVNKKYIKLAFLLLCKVNKYNYTLADFNNKCRLVTYGDDFIMSVHDDFIQWFNCKTISDVLKNYGIILTDANKGKEIKPFQSLMQSTFLKRTFKKHPYRSNVWLAPIDVRSITECLNWCHKQTNMKAATEEVIRASCVLAFGHGPEFYKQHADKIHKVAIEEGLVVEYLSWEEMDRSYFG